MSSALLQRIRALGGLLGTMFGGNRDLYTVFGYEKTLSYQHMFLKYARQDIATRIVEAEPRAVWSAPPLLTSSAAFQKAWETLITDHALFDKFYRVDKLCGLGRYAVLLVGYDDTADYSKPVKKGRNNKILYLQPYSEPNAIIKEWEDDVTSPHYGMPRTYELKVSSDDTTLISRGSATTARPVKVLTNLVVHRSRVLHMVENTLEDPVYGFPRLQRVYNLLDDLLKTTGGSAETFWLTSNRGMQFDIDKDMELQQGDADALSDEIDEYMHNLRRTIRTKGVKINNLGSDVADPRGTFNVLIALLSGATGIPQRILLGAEAGQLASEQDRANWAVRIAERRMLFAEPTVLRPFIKMQQENNALPSTTKLSFMWPDAFIQNPLERAQTSAQTARSLANVSKALSSEVPVITPEEGRGILGISGPAPKAKQQQQDGDGNGVADVPGETERRGGINDADASAGSLADTSGSARQDTSGSSGGGEDGDGVRQQNVEDENASAG